MAYALIINSLSFQNLEKVHSLPDCILISLFIHLCFLPHRKNPGNPALHCAVFQGGVFFFKNQDQVFSTLAGLPYLFRTGRLMGVLYNSNLQLFLPGNGKAKMGSGICTHRSSPDHGTISIVAPGKRPFRCNGYYRFNRLLAAGFILYTNQRK